MTIPNDPAAFAKALVRHVRNSHAIGKLVVETAVRSVTKKPAAPSQPSTEPSREGNENPSGTARGGIDEANPYSDLPLPVAQWGLLSSGDVVDMIERFEEPAVRAIGAFEEAHRRRRLVIQAVKNRLGQ